MESRVEARKKEFKKTFEDARRRRDDAQVQIRKQERETRLSKRRADASVSLGLPGEGSGAMQQRLADEMEALKRAMMSDSREQQLEAATTLRKLLSVEDSPQIQIVVDAGLVPRFVQFLKDESSPNLQFEAAWALTNIASGTHEQTAAVVDAQAVPTFIALLSAPREELREQAAWALGNIAGDCLPYRNYVLNLDGLTPLLEELKAVISNPSKITMLRNTAWALSNLCRGKPRAPLDRMALALPVLRELIYSRDTEVLGDACWSLSYISDGNDNESPQAIELVVQSGVAGRLVQLLGHPNLSVQTPVLRTVGNIVSGNEAQTQAMIAAGCVQALRNLLSSSATFICKEAAWSLSNITAGTRNQIQVVIKEDVISMLVETATHSSEDVRKEAMWAIANAASEASPQQVYELVKQNIIKVLADALGTNDSKLTVVTLEALENVLKAGQALAENSGTTDNPYAILLEEAQGFPKLETLQYTPENSKTYQLAMHIMTTYLACEECPDSAATAAAAGAGAPGAAVPTAADAPAM